MKKLRFEASFKQTEAIDYLHDKVTTELGYGGAAAGGKSYLGCYWITEQCLLYPETSWLIGRKDLINLKRTTLLTLFKLWKSCDLKEFNYNQQNNVITLDNGSKIFLFDLSYQPSDPLYTRLGGLELTGAFFDESNEIPSEAINIAQTRIGRKNNDKYGLKPKSLECFNPDKGHVYSRFYKPNRDGTLPSHRKFIKALPTDNPHTSEDYINQLRNSDKVTRERLLLGNFEYDDDPSALITYDAILDLWTNSVAQGLRALTCDVARFGGDKIMIYLWDGDAITKVWARQFQGLDQTTALLKLIASEERVPYSFTVADDDGMGGGVVDNMRGIKGFVGNSSPIEVNFKRPNYQNLKAQCTYRLAERINNRSLAIRVVQFNTNIPGYSEAKWKEELVEELEQIKAKDIDKDGKMKIRPKDETKEVLGRSPDSADTMMMKMLLDFEPPIPEHKAAVQFYPHMNR